MSEQFTVRNPEALGPSDWLELFVAAKGAMRCPRILLCCPRVRKAILAACAARADGQGASATDNPRADFPDELIVVGKGISPLRVIECPISPDCTVSFLSKDEYWAIRPELFRVSANDEP